MPLLSSFLFRKAKAIRRGPETIRKKTWYLTWQGFENAKAYYRRLLEAALRRRLLFLLSVIGAFVLSPS